MGYHKNSAGIRKSEAKHSCSKMRAKLYSIIFLFIVLAANFYEISSEEERHFEEPKGEEVDSLKLSFQFVGAGDAHDYDKYMYWGGYPLNECLDWCVGWNDRDAEYDGCLWVKPSYCYAYKNAVGFE